MSTAPLGACPIDPVELLVLQVLQAWESARFSFAALARVGEAVELAISAVVAALFEAALASSGCWLLGGLRQNTGPCLAP